MIFALPQKPLDISLQGPAVIACALIRCKDVSIDFVTGLPASTNWKSKIYDSILVIVDRLTKMVNYEPVKVKINVLGLTKVNIDVVLWHHGLSDLIVIDLGSEFTSKFWLLLCYFLNIK